MRHSRTIALWAVLSSLAATTAFAQQEGTTGILEIDLVGRDCDAVAKVFAVMQDNEAAPIPADKDKIKDCRWRLETKRFRTNLVHFSLRLVGLARTRCKAPTWDASKNIAKIEFNLLGPVERITLMPDPPMSLPYAREVHGDKEYVACTETGTLPAGPITLWNISEVDLTNETLRLRDFESKKDVCGLLVNSLTAIKTARKKKGVAIPLGRKTLVDALSLQRDGKDHCQMPNLSPAAIDITEKHLKERGLTTISVTVNP
jgi:hypothetical protein